MRISLWVYGLLYLLVEVTGHQLETVGWARITPLDFAEAVTDAALAVAVALAALLAAHLGAQRWRRSMAAWHDARGLALLPVFGAGPITVTSWRTEPLALPAAPAPRYPPPEGPLDGGAPYR
jgi:hypothetical protein